MTKKYTYSGVCHVCQEGPKTLVASAVCRRCYRRQREQRNLVECRTFSPEKEARIEEYRRRYEAGEPIFPPGMRQKDPDE